MIAKNRTIISLYSSVFLIISLLTAYFPLWLNEALEIDAKYIGFILSFSGILKVFFSLMLVTYLKSSKYYKPVLIYINSLLFLIFLFIFSYGELLSLNFILIITIGFLILFAPVLPIIESLYSHLVKEALKNYGKIRISGSISFCLGVFIFGYLINNYSLSIFPLIFTFSLGLLLVSIIMLPKNLSIKNHLNKSTFNNLSKNNNIYFYLIICSLLQATHAMYYGYSTIVWQQKGFSFFLIGLLWSFAIFSEVLVFFFIDRYFKGSYFYNSLLFCAALTFLRWILTYFIENFYFLLLIQTLHGVSFALTHYIMIYFINSKVNKESKLLAQTTYHTLTGGFFITILTISCGYIMSYNSGEIGYLLMSLLALGCLVFMIIKRKV